MKKDYKVGDRVLVNVFSKEDILNNGPGTIVKGVIIEPELNEGDYISSGSIFSINYDDPFPYKSYLGDDVTSRLHHYSSLELDKQYYREERLKKLLNRI